MNAEFVHDDYELRRLWHAANPGVTPTPWDGPPAVRPILYVVLPQPDDSDAPINLAEYRRQRRQSEET